MPRKTGTPFRLDLAGQKFGRWTVIKNAGSGLFLCRCECGTEALQYSSPLTRGASKSCGCLALEMVTTHGMEGSPTYYSWASMKQRCQNPKAPDYYRYGGRGITVCQEWQTFSNFLRDMGVRPTGKTLDRIDGNGPYAPGNVRWETPKRQSRNRNVTQMVTFNGKRKPLADWADKYGIPRRRLRERLAAGWSIEEALTKPNRNK